MVAVPSASRFVKKKTQGKKKKEERNVYCIPRVRDVFVRPAVKEAPGAMLVSWMRFVLRCVYVSLMIERYISRVKAEG